MTHDAALALVGDLLKLGLLLCVPLMGVVLIVGLIISVLQVVTQVQDPSISFVPKLIIVIIAMVLLAPWMLGRLTSYATEMFLRLPQVG
jgi:flagellar biosynthesis protein FliQ